MGQNSKQRYRVGESSGGDFLSPTTGTFIAPIKFLPYAIGVFGLAFLASCITASIMTPVQNSDATSSGINADINSVAYYVNITSNNGNGGTISKDIQATYAGTRGIITDTLKITSNTPSGYQVYLDMKNDDSKGQNLVNTDNSTYFLSPVSGSLSNPGNLSSANTWGVAAPVGTNGIGNSLFSNYSEYTDASVSVSTRFAPVPAHGEESLLFSRTGSTVVDGAESDTSLATVDTVPVYYGYYANSSLPSGTYANTVRYTAYAEATENTSGIAAFTGNLVYKTGGTARFVTSLYTDRNISTSDITTLTIGGEACTNPSISKVAAGTNDSVVIECTAPAQKRPGDYTAVVKMDKFGYNASTTVSYDTDGIVIVSGTYAGAYKEMQDITNGICHAWTDGMDTKYPNLWDSTTNAPKAFTTSTQKPTYSYDTYDEATVAASPTDSAYFAVRRSARVANINDKVPETYLKDNRDDNYYRVRKLADGNCWMTENLRLVFARDGSLEVGTVESDGMTITGTGNYISTSNTQITAMQLSNLSSIVAYTETGHVNNVQTGTKGVDYTVWGADDSDTVMHSTKTATVPEGAASDLRISKFARSFYGSTTRDDCKKGLNNPGLGASMDRDGDCWSGDNDEQTMGTFYNYTAATAGVNPSSGSSNSSICPLGWKLPDGTTTSTQSLYNLIVNIYGGGEYDKTGNPQGILASADVRSSAASDYSNLGYYHTWAIVAAVRLAPISMVFSGDYDSKSASVNSAGRDVAFWTSNAVSNTSASRMVIFEGLFYALNNSWKGPGYNIRCVAQ